MPVLYANMRCVVSWLWTVTMSRLNVDISVRETEMFELRNVIKRNHEVTNWR